MRYWKGAAAGAVAAILCGKGIAGALMGAVIGYNVEVFLLRGFFSRRAASSQGVHGACSGEDPYSVLGVGSDTAFSEIRSAYRELVKKNHPDAIRAAGGGEEEIARATRRMARINEAWEEIKRRRR